MKKTITAILLCSALIVSSFALFSCDNSGKTDETTASDNTTAADVTTANEETTVEETTAEETTAAEESPFEGTGTQEDPYIIASATDFETFHTKLRDGVTFSGLYFKQTADIDTDGLNIGVSDTSTFDGIYDGFGHTIHVNIVSDTTENNIFPTVSGIVANLGTTGTIAPADDCHACGIARTVSGSGIIFNVWSTVAVTTGTHSAGIAYHNYGTIACTIAAGKLSASSRQYPVSTVNVDGGKYYFVYAASDIQTDFDAEDFKFVERTSRAKLNTAVDAINENLEKTASDIGITGKVSTYNWTIEQLPEAAG